MPDFRGLLDMKTTRPFLALMSLLTSLAVAGCGGGQRATVRGKVIFADGTPVTSAIVVFQPLDKEQKLSPRGYVEADGSFEMATAQLKDGAPLGRYKVAVVPAWNTWDPIPFDAKFADYATSGLEFEVKSGANEFPITLTKAAKGTVRKTFKD